MNFNPETPRTVGALGVLSQDVPPSPGGGRLLAAPIIDLVLILLGLGLVALVSTRRERALAIELPLLVQATPLRRGVAEIVVNIAADGRLSLNGQVVDWDTLRARFRRARGEFAGSDAVLIRADGSTPHHKIIDILSACRAAGLRSISFVTAPLEEHGAGDRGR